MNSILALTDLARETKSKLDCRESTTTIQDDGVTV